MRSLCLALVLCSTVALARSRSVSATDSLEYFALKSAATLESLEKAVKIYPMDGDVWYQLAQKRLQEKHYDAAIEAYQHVFELGGFANKLFASCHYDIACAYALKGDTKAAIASLQTSLDKGFRDLNHVQTDKDLESLHKDVKWEEMAATKDVSKMSRDEAWRYDLWLYNREVRRIHLNPYQKSTKDELDKEVKSFNREIPKLSDHQIRMRFMRLAVLIGDGHTILRGFDPATAKQAPITVFRFDDGYRIIAIAKSKSALLGAKILQVAGHDAEEVLKASSPFIAKDNSMGDLAISPRYFTNADLLKGLGWLADTNEIGYVVEDVSGKKSTLVLQTIAGPTPAADLAGIETSLPTVPLSLKDRAKPYWFEYLAETKTVYFQYNSVRNITDLPVSKFAEKLFEFIQTNDVENLVIDARWNGGGNTFLSRPLVNGIIASKKVNRPGHLFVITGRHTFSAAQNFVTDIERSCEATFVGEPSGSSPNFTGESVLGVLPYSKMTYSISDLHWQRSWPMDARTWIAPDLPAPPSFSDLRLGLDSAFEAIKAFLLKK
ncbi:MAG: hypothetical protein ABL949_00385 [Fimbriimonadaceae bacterium]